MFIFISIYNFFLVLISVLVNYKSPGLEPLWHKHKPVKFVFLFYIVLNYL